MSFCVAIDGPAASGKGTISRAVAAHFGFAHLDTGLLYRGVGAKVLAGADPLEAAQSLTAEDLQDPALRTDRIAQAASQVAVNPDVRAALVDFQRAFATRAGGAVLDGRDIGTVICPDAQVKIFVTAAPEERARRRLAELLTRGVDTDFDTVLADVHARDDRDRTRSTAPLCAASDAVEIDTTGLDIQQAIDSAVTVIAAKAQISA